AADLRWLMVNLDRAQQLFSGHPDALAVIQRLRPMVQTHRDHAAISKHALGDEVRLLIQRTSESPRVVTVRHVSDY
ncbi:MAG TPA: hypothetical protein VET25_11335, partial [Aestuariivirgaceae bacterium]|nr:hypothetical protein [Aestuariivirgaceae bacterium]